jgi:hypothetical protein
MYIVPEQRGLFKFTVTEFMETLLVAQLVKKYFVSEETRWLTCHRSRKRFSLSRVNRMQYTAIGAVGDPLECLFQQYYQRCKINHI